MWGCGTQEAAAAGARTGCLSPAGGATVNVTRVQEVCTKGPKPGGDMGSTSPFPGTGRTPQGSPIPAQTTAGGRQGRTRERGRSRCISSPDQGVCVCVGGRGGWACGHIYCLFPPAPAPCAHTGGRDPRAQPTARWTFTLLCKQAGARLGYQLEFHPVNGTRSLSGWAAEHLPSSPALCTPMDTPMQQGSLGDARFVPLQDSVPL